MSENWFYAYEGKTHGPFSSEEIKALVATGLLADQEPVWPEGKEANEAIPASAVSDGAGALPGHGAPASVATAAGASVPDWVSDVAALESVRATEHSVTAQDAHADESLEWLEDLRIWVGLDVHDSKQTLPGTATREQPPGKPIPVAEPPSKRRKKKRRLAADSIPIAMPVAAAVPEPEVPTGESEPPLRIVDTLAQQTLAETGFDFKTGRVVNAARFKKWKQQKTRASESNQSDMTNASQLELFRRARTAVEAWVEDEKNRQRILESTLKQIKNSRALQDIYTQYAGLGFRQKLEKYLEFLVVNRKKIYQALVKRVT
jgi:hypothetical protein